MINKPYVKQSLSSGLIFNAFSKKISSYGLKAHFVGVGVSIFLFHVKKRTKNWKKL